MYGQFDCDGNIYRQWGEDYLWSYLTACCDLVRWRNLWADWKQFLQLELVHSKLYISACMRWSDMKYNSWVGTFTSDISAFSDNGDPAADCRDRNRVLAFPHLNSQTDMHIHPSTHSSTIPAVSSEGRASLWTCCMVTETNMYTYGHFKVVNQPDVHVFRQWVELE